jgi:putative flippase GtrA
VGVEIGKKNIGLKVSPVTKIPAKELFRFAIVGTFCFGAGIASLYVLTEYGQIHYLLSMAISLLIVNLIGWALNRVWTFESRTQDTKQEFARYLAVNVAGFGITLLLMAVLVSGFGMNYLIASMIVAALMMLANFIIHRNWSFRHRGNRHRPSIRS